jgi:tetratricopeptide (TPR) repeat protein
MDKEELRERYEATGDEGFYRQAMPLYEEALARSPDDARLLTDYGYLQECHARRALHAAVACYQRAIDADPAGQKAHFQLIGAMAALREADSLIPRYEQRVAAAPHDPAGYRLLARVCLAAGDHGRARLAIHAGLGIEPGDAALTELQGDLYAATGRPNDALAAWHRAWTLAPEDYGISMRFSAAFLAERLGRLAEAAGEWRFIVGWCEDHGDTIHTGWPRRELARIEALLGAA